MIKIRPATLSDLDALVHLQIEFEKFFQGLEDHYYKIPRSARRDEIRENNFGRKKFMRTLVAEITPRNLTIARGPREHDGTVIGAISFYPGFLNENPPERTYHFPYLFVEEKFRGPATMALLNAVKKLAKAENIKRLVFSVYGRNKPARKLYEHIGAKYWAADADEHFMYFDI